MNIPWVELEQHQDQDDFAGLGFAEYVWQAIFACQIGVRPHHEWAKLKWGFNAAALFEEFLERQRLFLESQYAIKNEVGMENADHRTLALRYINRPGEGLVLAVIAKIHGRTEAEAKESALAFFRELKSTFPYDYTLSPALTRDEFLQISARDVLDARDDQFHIAQIKRFEVPVYFAERPFMLQGLWQSGLRVHEQIWRALSGSLYPLFLNMSIRCTVLYEGEREKLSRCAEEMAQVELDESPNQRTLSKYRDWNQSYTEHRLAPWKKFFYLQVHLASNRKLDENLSRIIGTSITWNTKDSSLPGYHVITPRADESSLWRKKLKNLDLIFSGSYLPVPRLAEVADSDEVFAVMRLPYSPPDMGFPDVTFADPKAL